MDFFFIVKGNWKCSGWERESGHFEDRMDSDGDDGGDKCAFREEGRENGACY